MEKREQFILLCIVLLCHCRHTVGGLRKRRDHSSRPESAVVVSGLNMLSSYESLA